MVYIRKKQVKGADYLYLVKSIWDKRKKIPKQKIIKYLGQASLVSRDKIPVEYRNSPKVISYLLENTPQNKKTENMALKKLQSQLHSSLIKGDLTSSLRISNSFIKKSSMDKFYEKILNPVMENIGYMWQNDKLTIASEHIASNTTQSIIKIISDKQKKSKLDKGKILLTTPIGEEHNIGCNVLESFLLSKGYTVYNLSPSTPAQSLLRFMKTVNVKVVIISIMTKDNIKSGKRLAKKIYDENKHIKIILGGQALRGSNTHSSNITIINSSKSLYEIAQMLKEKH